MKAKQYIPMAVAGALLVAVSCVKDTLYNTPHPDHGKITVTADWADRGEGIEIPAAWRMSMADYTGSASGAIHAPDHLFEPGTYTLTAWNPVDKITVDGTVATVTPATGNGGGVGVFIEGDPDWFFTHVQQVQIEKDTDHTVTAAMKQQTRELTLVIEPTGDAADRITEIIAYLTGVAGTLDFATGTYGAVSNVELPFTKITDGADAGKWMATVRLLGITGGEQKLKGEIRYAEGNPLPTMLDSDLSEVLKDFNTKKNESMALGGTLVKTPDEVDFSAFEISGWERIDGGNVGADL